MPTLDYSNLTVAQIRQLVGTLADWQVENAAFYDGDHLQGGKGWIGPKPDAGATGYATFVEALKANFISQNAIKAAADTQVNAIIGREPRWGMVPLEAIPEQQDGETEEQLKARIAAWQTRHAALLAETDAALTPWWDARGIHGLLQEFATRYEVEGRAYLRIFIPPGLLTEQGTIPPGDLPAQLARLYVEVADNAQARLVSDPRTMASFGLYLFKEETETVNADGKAETRTVDRAEVTYLDPQGRALLTTTGTAADGAVAVNIGAHDLGGALWHWQAEGEPLITAQVRAMQKLLNLAKNTEARNMKDGGWPEEFRVNTAVAAQYAEKETTDATTGETTTRLTATPAAVTRGPGQIQSVISETYQSGYDKDGNPTYAPLPADVKWRPPVDPAHSIATADDAERAIAKEVHQEHLMQTGSDANSSGEYLKQKRANFVMNLGQSVAVVNAAGRWTLETVLRAALQFAGDARPVFDLLKVDFACVVEAGPQTADETREQAALVAAGIMSRETMQIRIGIVDPDAENARIMAEEKENLTALKLRADIFAALGGRAGNDEAAAVSGLSDMFPTVDVARTDSVPVEGQ